MFKTLARLVGSDRSTAPSDVGQTAIEGAIARNLIAPGRIPGFTVNSRSGMAYVPIWRCINLISSTIGGMPWRLTEERGLDRITLADDPVDFMLYRSPNNEVGPFGWRETIVSHALSWGDGFAEIERTLAGDPVAMWNITPDRVEVDRDRNGRLVYLVNDYMGAAKVEGRIGSRTTILAAEDVFHLRGLGFDGVRGYSPIELHAKAIACGRAADGYVEQFFLSGGQPYGIIKYAGPKLTPEIRRRIKRLFYRMLPNRANGKSSGHVMLPSGFDYQKVSVNPQEAAVIEARKYQREEVALIYGVPPHMVGGDDPSLSNIEHRRIEFATSTLMPWVLRLEQEADLKLVGREGMARKRSTNISMTSLLRADTNTRANYYKALGFLGAFSINDVLRLEDMPTIGPEGDVRLVQEQMTPLDLLAELKMAKANSGAQPGKSDEEGSNESPLAAVAVALGRERNELVNRIEAGSEPAEAIADWRLGVSDRMKATLASFAVDPSVAAVATAEFEKMVESQLSPTLDAAATKKIASEWPESYVAGALAKG